MYVKNKWTEQGLDQVKLINYTVLLSYPNYDKPNSVKILDKNGKSVYNSSFYETPLNATKEEEKYYYKNPPFLAFAPSTKKPVVSELVYVNYGRIEDYEYLKKININVKGKLVIARYGKLFRGSKLHLAEINGAVGLILYDDPADFNDPNNLDNVYPKSIYLPKTGVQRGSVLYRDGDPLTPFYPATSNF